MNEALIIQLAISALGITGSAIGALVVITKKLGSNGNGCEKDIQQQMESGTDGTKTLAARFEEQVGSCNEKWLKVAEDRGRDGERYSNIERFMEKISEELEAIRNK